MTEPRRKTKGAFAQNWLSIIFLSLVVIGGVKGFINRMHPAQSAKDTVTWKQMAEAKFDGKKAVYPATLEAQEGKNICISGYMFPLQGAEDQSHFLLSPISRHALFACRAGRKN